MLENTRKSLKVGWRQKTVIPSALPDLETVLEEHRLSPTLLPMGPEKSGQPGRSLLSARHRQSAVLVGCRRMLTCSRHPEL